MPDFDEMYFSSKEHPLAATPSMLQGLGSKTLEEGINTVLSLYERDFLTKSELFSQFLGAATVPGFLDHLHFLPDSVVQKLREMVKDGPVMVELEKCYPAVFISPRVRRTESTDAELKEHALMRQKAHFETTKALHEYFFD
ncbi:MAG: hypothetical protein AAF585_22845 [Verrucomicrobiota bacterium]